MTDLVGMTGFHEGERLVQDRAHVREYADQLGQMMEPAQLGAGASRYLSTQSLIVLTARDSAGILWSSAVQGAPGFLTVEGTRLLVAGSPRRGDPLAGLEPGQAIGTIIIDLRRRRRLRINGLLAATAGGLAIEVAQAYGNCPRYIQPRGEQPVPADSPGSAVSYHGAELLSEHRDWIERSMRMFVGSTHPGHGVDASHRGGPPGFVQWVDGALWWPDYPGNNLFNTLGNIAADPCTSLLFVDFERNRSLHLSGTAEIDWDLTRARSVPEIAERGVLFTARSVVQVDGG